MPTGPEDHRATCYHCGRPENEFPFTYGNLELYSSESDAGRWRHWGGDDIWTCLRCDEFDVDPVEHFHNHGLLTLQGLWALMLEYMTLNQKRLQQLDRRSPRGGWFKVKGKPSFPY